MAKANSNDIILDSLTSKLDPKADRTLIATSKFGDKLATYMVGVVAAPYSDGILSALENEVYSEGRVKGRSKQKVVIEEDEPEVTEESIYIRPNGERYYPRTWGNMEDVQVLRTARQHMQFPFLYGPPGTGKTAMAEAAFEDLITIVISGDTEVSDLVGSFTPDPANVGSFVWIDGPLLEAVRGGHPVLLDEIGLGDPKVLSVVYSLMDGRGELHVTSNPDIGVVKAAEGFFILGATNPNAPGVRMSEALLSRFTIHTEVTTDFDLAIKLGVPSTVVRIAKNLASKQEQGNIDWAPQFRELLAYREVNNVFGSDFALANMLASCPQDDRAEVEAAIVNIVGPTKGSRI